MLLGLCGPIPQIAWGQQRTGRAIAPGSRAPVESPAKTDDASETNAEDGGWRKPGDAPPRASKKTPTATPNAPLPPKFIEPRMPSKSPSAPSQADESPRLHQPGSFGRRAVEPPPIEPPEDEASEPEETPAPPRRKVGPPASKEAQQAWLDGDPETLEPSRFFELPEERYRGPGLPMTRESWSFRPYSFSMLVGFMQGGSLIKDYVYHGNGPIGGIRLGWDFSYYFGAEMRLAVANIEVYDNLALIPIGPTIRYRNDDIVLWDINLCYYPWGDAKWRPYVNLGFGTTRVHFGDALGIDYRQTLFSLPFGLGLKYSQNEFLAFRLDLTDNLAFGGGRSLETMHNLSLTAGVEFRFGGARRAYWPWNPSRGYW